MEHPSLHGRNASTTEPIAYLCTMCDAQFFMVESNVPVCPQCGASGEENIKAVGETQLEDGSDDYPNR